MRALFYCSVLLVLASLPLPASCQAGWKDWRVQINGVDIADINGRSLPWMLAGAVLSYTTHELGHVGMTYAQGHTVTGFDGIPPAIHVNGMTPEIASAGFVSQVITGAVLTIVNKGDLSYGFNAFTCINAAGYTAISTGLEYGDTRAMSEATGTPKAGLVLSAGTFAASAYLWHEDWRE